MAQDEILNCPFCGEKPKYSRWQSECLWSHNIVWWEQICCNICDIQIGWPVDGGETIDRWNMRDGKLAKDEE